MGMEIFQLFGKIVIDGKSANREIDETTGKARDSENKMVTSFRNIGAAVGTFISVGAIASFGKSCVESAANVKATEAQFVQVFGDLQSNAQTTIDNMGNTFGMLPSRIKPSFTQATSMFKGLGLSTEDAMVQAQSSVTMAADAAAFFDKSYEEANGALNSFIKGNYEGGESIGLFANETQLASWASQNLGLDWKNLDEAGKQVARLEFAQAMQEAAGATGQAARESDGYENQMGNLKEAWAQFQAVIGAPILQNIVIPAIQALVGGLQGMVEKIKEANQFYQDHKAILEPLSILIGSIALIVGAFAAGMAIYNIAAGAMAVVNGILTGSFATLLIPILPILVILGLLVGAGILLYQNWDTIKQKCGELGQWLGEKWEGIKASVGGAIETLKTNASNKWEEIKTGAQSKWEEIKNNVSTKASEMQQGANAAMDLMKNIAGNIFGALKSAATGDTEGLKQNLLNIWNMIPGPIQNAISSIYNNTVGRFNAIRENVVGAVQGIFDRVSGVWNQICGILSGDLPFPHISLPHFSISGNFSLNPPRIPSFGVEWYAKGGIMNDPTIFGMNGRNAMVGGEKGPEAIAPISTLQAYIREAVDGNNAGILEVLKSMYALLLEYFPEFIPKGSVDIDGRIEAAFASKALAMKGVR